MKHYYYGVAALLLAAAATTARAQGVGIGTPTPDAAAALDITAAGKGLLIPRLDSVARVRIANPPTGLMVFQVGTASPRTRTGFYYYAGGAWLYLPDKAGAGDNLGNGVATTDLTLNEHSITLRTAGDYYHALAYKSSYDGPSLYGYNGGGLGYGYGGSTTALRWDNAGLVGIPKTLAVGTNGANVGTGPDFSLGGAGTGEGIGSARNDNNPNQYGLDFYTGFNKRVSLTNAGSVGIGTDAPYSLLANTPLNIIGSDNNGGGLGSLAWATGQNGYVAQFFNQQNGPSSNGLVVKVANATTATALDVSASATVSAAGTPLLTVKAGGNVGVGTNTPASTLTVAGSLAAAYAGRTASYTLTATDYFVAYNGTAAATFTLPAAQAGPASLQGRVYKIKNNAGQALTIVPAGNERINAAGPISSVLLAANSVAELISTGATSGTTWELVSSGPLTYTTDGMRAALASTGCASCAAYDAAAANTWVSVSAADYTALKGLSGAAVYGTSSLAGTVISSFGANYTCSSGATNQSPVPAANYPYALAVRSGTSAPSTMAGLKLKLSPTSDVAGYADWPTAGTAVPNGPTPLAAATTYYYVLKRPSAATTAVSYLALYLPQDDQVGIIDRTGSGVQYERGDATDLTTSYSPYATLFQLVATPTRQW